MAPGGQIDDREAPEADSYGLIVPEAGVIRSAMNQRRRHALDSRSVYASTFLPYINGKTAHYVMLGWGWGSPKRTM
jgi:hypothetical protein